MFKFGPSNHTRNYPFRPPMKPRPEAGTDWPLYWRFIRQYVWPKRWSLFLCICLIATNSCSVYLMSFYSRLVVDEILVIKSAGANKTAETTKKSIFGGSMERPIHVDEHRISMGQKSDQGVSFSKRPPGA